MKFGIKVWSTNKELLKCIKKNFLKKDFDFIELCAIKNSFDASLLSDIKGIPVVVHCDNDNVNFAKKECYKENLVAIQETQKFADFLDARYTIIHPGHDGCSENVNLLLDEIKDERFCIENMPGRTIDQQFDCIGRTYHELKIINTNKYCLDFSHAIKAAISLNIDIFENIEELLGLNPVMFHISDGSLDNDIDEHLNIGDGNYDFTRISRFIEGEDKLITIETPKKTYTNLDNDLLNIKKIKKYFV